MTCLFTCFRNQFDPTTTLPQNFAEQICHKIHEWTKQSSTTRKIKKTQRKKKKNSNYTVNLPNNLHLLYPILCHHHHHPSSSSKQSPPSCRLISTWLPPQLEIKLFAVSLNYRFNAHDHPFILPSFAYSHYKYTHKCYPDKKYPFLVIF